jgi:hypothetical protein
MSITQLSDVELDQVNGGGRGHGNNGRGSVRNRGGNATAIGGDGEIYIKKLVIAGNKSYDSSTQTISVTLNAGGAATATGGGVTTN